MGYLNNFSSDKLSENGTFLARGRIQ